MAASGVKDLIYGGEQPRAPPPPKLVQPAAGPPPDHHGLGRARASAAVASGTFLDEMKDHVAIRYSLHSTVCRLLQGQEVQVIQICGGTHRPQRARRADATVDAHVELVQSVIREHALCQRLTQL